MKKDWVYVVLFIVAALFVSGPLLALLQEFDFSLMR